MFAAITSLRCNKRKGMQRLQPLGLTWPFSFATSQELSSRVLPWWPSLQTPSTWAGLRITMILGMKVCTDAAFQFT